MENNQLNKNNDFFKDFHNMQKQLIPVKKTSKNPFFKQMYANLSAVLESTKDALHENNFILTQLLTIHEGAQVLKTILMHSSGETLESIGLLNPEKNTPQGIGSAITYMRRYSIVSLLGLSQEDDDGNAASNHAKTDNKTNSVKPKPPAPKIVPKNGNGVEIPGAVVKIDYDVIKLVDKIQKNDPEFSIEEMNPEMKARFDNEWVLALKSGKWEKVSFCARVIKDSLSEYIEFLNKPLAKSVPKNMENMEITTEKSEVK